MAMAVAIAAAIAPAQALPDWPGPLSCLLSAHNNKNLNIYTHHGWVCAGMCRGRRLLVAHVGTVNWKEMALFHINMYIKYTHSHTHTHTRSSSTAPYEPEHWTGQTLDWDHLRVSGPVIPLFGLVFSTLPLLSVHMPPCLVFAILFRWADVFSDTVLRFARIVGRLCKSTGLRDEFCTNGMEVEFRSYGSNNFMLNLSHVFYVTIVCIVYSIWTYFRILNLFKLSDLYEVRDSMIFEINLLTYFVQH